MSISGIFALSDEINNLKINTGSIDIDVNTYRLNELNQEVEIENNDLAVIPGEKISVIPKIKNTGLDCYIRIKFTYINENVDITQFVTGFSEKLIKNGDYYYSVEPLKEGDTLKLFDEIKIPEYVDKNNSNGKIKLIITAQAIQEKNFSPDYSLDDPWKGINPTKSINNSYNINTNDEESNVVVKFENNISDDVSISNTIFDSFKNILPGDTCTEKISIKNNNKKIAKYYFRIEKNAINEDEEKLLKQINIKIFKENEETLYSGKLFDLDSILLTELEQNNFDDFYIKLEMPIDSGNEFGSIIPRFTMIFSAEYDEEGVIDANKNVKTGDSIDCSILIFIASTICLIIVIIFDYNYKKNKK